MITPEINVPLGPLVPSPPQWLDFVSRHEDQGAVEFTNGLSATDDQLKTINQRVNNLGYRADVTDNWNAYDISLPNFRVESLLSFDCDDATLTKRAMLHLNGVDIALLRPALCKIPPAQYGKGGADHMVLLVNQAGKVLVLDNIIPWVYPFEDAPYDWIAMVSTKNSHWRLIGWRWVAFKRSNQDETNNPTN